MLAPVGSPEALTAALRCGADAVYLGGGRFNARENAAHFTGVSLREAVEACHARGARVYLTLNTLLRQEELKDALALAEEACALGVDALIVQDLGLARLLYACAPDMPLHASTQLTVHTPAGVRLLRDSGFTRVVLAREMSRQEIAACASLGCELEVFVHGALCMSVSGQCYFSAMLGGRSGNRGLCAQPCRLPFRQDLPPGSPCPACEGEAALSLRDLSLREHLADLQSLGVRSFKIEGRMKRPEYVAAATAVCAMAVRGKEPHSVLIDDLQSVFSRTGFTDGYYTGRRGAAGSPLPDQEIRTEPNHPTQPPASMFGVRRREDVTAAEPVLSRLARLYAKETPRVPVKITMTLLKNKPVCLSVRDGEGRRAEAWGEPPMAAERRELGPQDVRRQLEKTGGTPFFVTGCEVEIGEGLMVSAAALNALRREALDRLLRLRAQSRPRFFDRRAPLPVEARGYSLLKRENDSPALAARCAEESQARALAGLSSGERPDLLIVPLSLPPDVLTALAQTGPLAVEIPRGMFGAEETIRQRLTLARDVGAEAALCGTVGALPLTEEAGLIPVGGFGLNLCNVETAAQLAKWGTAAAVLSVELTFHQMAFHSRMEVPAGLFAYGRLPLMLARNCPLREIGKMDRKGLTPCSVCGRQGGLVDRKGIRFPVRCEEPDGCVEVLNSAPIYLADQLNRLPPVDFFLLHFSDEAPEEAVRIAGAYRRGGPAQEGITRGLYRRGVQ